MAHPQVEACCVVGVADPQRGQKVKAFLVVKGQPDPQDILAHCQHQVAKYAMPKELVFVDSLPMTHLNKVDYKKLEEM